MLRERTRRSIVWVLLCAACLGSNAAHAEDPVYFEDYRLQDVVGLAVHMNPPTRSAMERLTRLVANAKGITSLVGLEYAVNLTHLDLEDNQISNLSPLSGLTQLHGIGLDRNQITDISPLSGLTDLVSLDLESNQISDISSLSGLTQLFYLCLYDNQITDISPLSGLPNLEHLLLQSNQISNISMLLNMTILSSVNLWNNPLNRDAYCHVLQTFHGHNPRCTLSYSPNANPPGGVSATDGPYPDRVGITWDALCPGPTRTDTFQYMVYRSTSLGGTKEAISGWLDSTSFDDTMASPGVHYWYWVKSNYSGEDYSDPDEGWRSAPPQRTLTVTSTAGGTVNAPGVGAFQCDDGTSVPVAAVAAANYHFVNWTGTAVTAGKVANPSSASTTVIVGADYTLQANFAIDRHTVTVSSTAGGSVSSPGEGSFEYDHGTSVPIMAAAEAHYHFTGWTGTAVDAGKVADPGSTSTTLTADAAYTVQANFAIDRHTITISCTPGGSVSAPGIGAFQYDYGSSVSIIAVAETNYHFAGWTGTAVTAGKVASPASESTTLTVDGDYTVQAAFAIDQRTLVILSTDGGSVSSPGEGAFQYDHGTTVPLIAGADTGYRFVKWTGTAVDASKVSDPSSVNTTVLMHADYTLLANFAVDTYTLTLNAVNGSVTATPAKPTYTYGESVLLQAVPNTGYSFTEWSGDLTGSTNPTTIVIDANKTVTANFAPNSYTLTVNTAHGSVARTPDKPSYDHGETVTLLATADTGFVFADWSAGLSGSANPATITMDGNKVVTANFAVRRWTLTVSATAGGSVIAPGEGTFEYDHGQRVALQAQADPLFTFVGWRGSIFTSANPYSVTMHSDHNVTAHFESILDVLYVDDDATGDPGPGDPNVSDPQEDGTAEHPFDMIQEAIDVAGTGARITVRPGTYFETISLLGKSIEVNGLNAEDPNIMPLPVIDGQGKDTVVRCTQREDPNCILRGFVITGGRGSLAGGILCVASSPTIANCVIVGSRATDSDSGGGIRCEDSNAVFVNCTISDNCGGSAGAGVCLFESNVILLDSIVWENEPAQIRLLDSDDSIVSYTAVAGGWPGDGILDADPLFIQPGYWADPANLANVLPATDPLAVWVAGDYHLMSQAGRWDPISAAWIADPVTSPCIDAGDPSTPVGQEPEPNAGRINMGVYGGTSQASRSANGG